MVRRVSLPAADELFRRTTQERPGRETTERAAEDPADDGAGHPGAGGGAEGNGRNRRESQPSGRVRHDEKMTVYVTAEELLAIEQARLALRSAHGLAVDRGRLVREAVAMALEDLDAEGEDSRLVQRLNER